MTIFPMKTQHSPKNNRMNLQAFESPAIHKTGFVYYNQFNTQKGKFHYDNFCKQPDSRHGRSP